MKSSSRRCRRKSRKVYKGGLFGAAGYVGSIAGNTIEQQISNLGNISPWSNSHSQELSNMYQGGRRRRTSFRRKRRRSSRR
jgi:hypothetical protein